MGVEKGAHGDIVEFAPIVGLESENWSLELRVDISKERTQNSDHIRFSLQGKRPDVMSEIIKNNKIEFIA